MTVWGKKKKRSRSDYLLDDFRWASRRLSSKSQQLSCCYMSYFCGSFPNLLFAYTRKILTSSLHLHVRFIQLRGGKKHSWAAQLKQHQPVLPVTRSVREVGISEAGWLAGPCAFPKESEANINFCCTDFHRCPRRTLLLKRQKQFCLFCLYFFPSAWFLNILNSVLGTIQDLCFMPKWVIMLLLQLSFTFHWLHLDSISQTHHFLLC